MRGKSFVLVVCIFAFCVSFVSAGLFGDVFHGITGNVITEVKPESFGENELAEITCERVKETFDKDFKDFEIPEAVPFKTEVFDVHIDDEFFISAELMEHKIELISCEKSEKATYNIYVKSKLILDAIGNKEKIKPLDFYHENRKNGQLKIKPVGVGRRLKMTFINFGLRIASWFD
ncbi:hypothetical protein KAS08_04495 [Candidatus Pacearchaeota archaeon]|nr:hypothetical protein [Candidatus Pacearchaeota archaeon]